MPVPGRRLRLRHPRCSSQTGAPRGCTAFDCFGAGQHVVEVTFAGADCGASRSSRRRCSTCSRDAPAQRAALVPAERTWAAHLRSAKLDLAIFLTHPSPSPSSTRPRGAPRPRSLACSGVRATGLDPSTSLRSPRVGEVGDAGGCSLERRRWISGHVCGCHDRPLRAMHELHHGEPPRLTTWLRPSPAR